MKLVFFDEVEQQQKDPDFFGVGSFVVDPTHYGSLCDGFEKCFADCGWDESIEFKGRYLFSQRGDSSVDINRRIRFVADMARGTVAKKNAKARFTLHHNRSGNSKDNYIALVGSALRGLPKVSNRKAGKHLVAIYYDQTDLITSAELGRRAVAVLADRGLSQVELPSAMPKSNRAVGTVYADVLCYLVSWDVLHPQPSDAEQLSLFELSGGSRDAEKLQRIREILSYAKSATSKRVETSSGKG